MGTRRKKEPRGNREGTKREPRGNQEVLKVGENGVRGYIDEGEEIKVENCRRKCGENGGKTRGTRRSGTELETRIV